MIRTTFIGLAMLALVAAGCGGDSDNDEPIQEGDTVTIEAKSALTFSPEAVAVLAGTTVTLVLDNTDASTEHDLEVQELEAIVVEGGADDHGHGDDGNVVAVHADAGKQASITFKAETPGTYRFVCTVPGHEDAGMFGELVVS